MFTGIIETTGLVLGVEGRVGGSRLRLDVSRLEGTLRDGDSLCINGVCLTAIDASPELCSFDVIPETLRCSTLGDLIVGQRVNLERSLSPSSRLDGHFVLGHVDAVAAVEHIDTSADQWVVWFAHEPGMAAVLIPKGSVAINGVSLTIAAVEPLRFGVALIPTTLTRTNLHELRIGDRVNVESDILARTVHHQLKILLPGGAPDGLLDLLQRQGLA